MDSLQSSRRAVIGSMAQALLGYLRTDMDGR